MWPALFRIPIPDWFPDFLKPASGTFPIRMFGVMVILGFLAGTYVASKRLAKRKIMTSEETFDFCFYLLATGILGSRLCFVVQDWYSDPERWKGRLFDIFKIWEGGLVWYGGMFLATVFAFWWLWKNKKPVLQVTDALALAVAIGLCVGRWGCFFVGDDYGRIIQDANGMAITDPAQVPWYAMQFPRGGPDENWRYAFSETPLSHRAPYWVHPVQLYMSLKNLVIFGLLLWVARKATKSGVLTATYLFAYPVGRFIIEFWRGDEDRGVSAATGLSFSQVFGIVPILIGIMVLKHVRSKPEESAPEATS